METRIRQKGEYCLSLMGYIPFKKNSIWKKTFGFALITAVVEDDRIIFRGYSANDNETFTYKAVRIPLVDFMPVEDVRKDIAFAECNLCINNTNASKYVNWGCFDPEEMDVSDFHLINEFNKEETE